MHIRSDFSVSHFLHLEKLKTVSIRDTSSSRMRNMGDNIERRSQASFYYGNLMVPALNKCNKNMNTEVSLVNYKSYDNNVTSDKMISH